MRSRRARAEFLRRGSSEGGAGAVIVRQFSSTTAVVLLSGAVALGAASITAVLGPGIGRFIEGVPLSHILVAIGSALLLPESQ